MTVKEYLDSRIEELTDLEIKAGDTNKRISQIAYAFSIKELELLRNKLPYLND